MCTARQQVVYALAKDGHKCFFMFSQLFFHSDLNCSFYAPLANQEKWSQSHLSTSGRMMPFSTRILMTLFLEGNSDLALKAQVLIIIAVNH